MGTCTSLSLLTLMIATQPAPPKERPAALVKVVPVVRNIVPDTREFIGTVMPVQKTVVGSAVDGRVEVLRVNRGELVERLTPLADLRTTTIGLEVAAAAAEVKLREWERNELEEGTRLKELAKAKAALERAKAVRDYGQSRFSRLEQAARSRAAVSTEELEEAAATSLAAQHSVDETQAAYDLAVEGPRIEVKQQAQARVDMAQATLDRLRDQMEKYSIKAPFTGYITEEYTEQGAWLSRGDPVVEMINIDQVEITVSVPEQYIASLAPDAVAQVQLEALPAGKPIVATVERIVPQADVRSRSFPVTILLDNPMDKGQHRLKAGMLANVKLAVGPTREALMVPKDALVLDPTGKAVIFVVRKDAERRVDIAIATPVDLGVYQKTRVEVIGQVREEDRVVVLGNERLSPRPPFTVVRPEAAEETMRSSED